MESVVRKEELIFWRRMLVVGETRTNLPAVQLAMSCPPSTELLATCHSGHHLRNTSHDASPSQDLHLNALGLSTRQLASRKGLSGSISQLASESA